MNARQARNLRPIAARIIEQRRQAVRNYELRSYVYSHGGGYPDMPRHRDAKHVQDPAWRIYHRKSLQAFDALCDMYDDRDRRRLAALTRTERPNA